MLPEGLSARGSKWILRTVGTGLFDDLGGLADDFAEAAREPTGIRTPTMDPEPAADVYTGGGSATTYGRVVVGTGDTPLCPTAAVRPAAGSRMRTPLLIAGGKECTDADEVGVLAAILWSATDACAGVNHLQLLAPSKTTFTEPTSTSQPSKTLGSCTMSST